ARTPHRGNPGCAVPAWRHHGSARAAADRARDTTSRAPGYCKALVPRPHEGFFRTLASCRASHTRRLHPGTRPARTVCPLPPAHTRTNQDTALSHAETRGI